LVAPGDAIILLPGTYTNPTYGDHNIWKQEQTMRISNLIGTAAKPITIKAETPGSAVLKGDGTAIFQLRNSKYVRVEGLTIVGEVQNNPWQEARDNRFIYQDQADGNKVKQRVDPSLTPAQTEALKGTLPKNIKATRPSLYSTDGLLVQGTTFLELVGNTVSYMPGTGISISGSDYVKARNNTVHNCSRRSSVGTHGFVVQLAANVDTTDTYACTRFWVEYNTVRDNYNEVYSWSELKDFISPYLDEGKGFTIQKSTAVNSGWTYGRFRIANNICHGNGFSGIHVRLAGQSAGRRVAVLCRTCLPTCLGPPAPAAQHCGAR